MRTTFSEFSRDVLPIWRPIDASHAPLRADGSKFLQHFPSMNGQPSPDEDDDLSANGHADDLRGFVAGALIACPEGARPVQDLEEGDLVETMDHGPQLIRRVSAKSQAAIGDLAPIRFSAGAFGAHQALYVGPHQRMHLAMPVMDILYGFSEGLAAAKHLVDSATVTLCESDSGEIEYFQLELDAHEIIWANGVATESLFSDEVGKHAVSFNGHPGIGHFFPDLADDSPQMGHTARPVLEGFEARLAMSYATSPSDMVLSG